MILVDENAGSAATVDYVVTVLFAAYGEAWTRSIGSAPYADVLSVWGNAIDDFSKSKNARRCVRWALNNLPDRCPNAMEFRNLCRKAPAAEVPQLEAPKADPARVAAELAKLAPARASAIGESDSKAWAHRILARHASGERLSPTVLAMACAALPHRSHQTTQAAGA